MSKENENNDYAYSLLMAQKVLKMLHENMLKRDYEKSRENVVVAIKWMLEIQEYLNGKAKGKDD